MATRVPSGLQAGCMYWVSPWAASTTLVFLLATSTVLTVALPSFTATNSTSLVPGRQAMVLVFSLVVRRSSFLAFRS